jgi:arylsulfatase A-like enzyme
VIFGSIHTTRADALSPYGAPSYVSPFLERLSRECVRYTQARSVAPLTLPAHASMLTGLYPPRHSVRDNGLSPLPASALTVAERALAGNAQTAAFVSALVLDRAFALDQGFEVYDQPPRAEQQTSSSYVERSAEQTIAAARAWMKGRDPTRPFFVFIHLYDPHVPYDPPRKYLEQAHGDPYRGEIAAADAALGVFFDELRADGTLAQTFLAISSDHGESLGEHGEPTHGAFCYDATILVPLLLRYPDARRAGEVANELVSIADLAPTFVEALGLPALPDIDGLSLFERRPLARSGVYCESYSGFLNYGWSPLCGFTSAQGKYLHSSRAEFYDLARDPKELRDLIDSSAETARAARDAIGRMTSKPVLSGGDASLISMELVRDLRSLGYGASGTQLTPIPHPLDGGDLPAPRDRAAELEPLLIANALLDARNFAEAAPILERLVEQNPRHLLGLDLYGFALLQLQRFDEARTILTRRLSQGSPRADTLVNCGVANQRSAHPLEARENFERALELDPENLQALEGLLSLALERGDSAAAKSIAAQLEALRSSLGRR